MSKVNLRKYEVYYSLKPSTEELLTTREAWAQQKQD
jgi:hypothetical protein